MNHCGAKVVNKHHPFYKQNNNQQIDQTQNPKKCQHEHKHHQPLNYQEKGYTEVIKMSALTKPEVTISGHIKTTVRIMQMDCPTEEALIRKKLGAMSFISSLEFNLIQRVLTIVHSPGTIDVILSAIRSLGFQPELPSNIQTDPTLDHSSPLWPLILAGIIAIASEVVYWVTLPNWLSAIFAMIAVCICGLTTYKKGWIAIKSFNLNINALMSIAVTGAFLLGQWSEAAMVMVLFTIAELIESRSVDRARNAINELIKLAPEKIAVQQKDGSWLETEVEQVAIDDIIKIKPGERVGLDGIIISGHSTINQSQITGESLPIEKIEGDSVFAGTLNQSGAFIYRATATATTTTLARIIHAVEEAQGLKAPTQRFVDQFARVYTPSIFIIALIVAIIPPLFMSEPWHYWIYKALVLLVIACPCALVISTPVTIVSGLVAAARHGILIKGGVYLEIGHKLKWIALDKTGTITHGKPVQTDFEMRSFDQINPQYSEQHCYNLAVSLASYSDHPVSQAILQAAPEHLITIKEVKNFETLLGRGVLGTIDGIRYYLGNHRLIHELGRGSTELEARLNTLEKQGKTVVALINDKQVLALLAVADTIKENSRHAIIQLHELGIKTIILTGDNTYTAHAIAEQAGINEARGDLLPEDKLNIIKQLEQEGYVGMVGDGTNDAPALAQATIGFAMGAMGTDTAIETADIALMNDDLEKIPTFIQLSKATRTILIQNITLALGIKILFLILTMMSNGSMWLAVFADMGTSLLVVANGLRLLKK